MKKSILLSLLFIGLSAMAQQDFTLYGIHDIPQSAYSNPSNRFNGSFYIGLPAFSSNYFSFSNSGFAYSDVVRKRNNELLLDFGNMIKVIDDQNYLSFSAKIDLLSFGISLNKKTQLSVNITENIGFKFSYPKDLMEFIYLGNSGFGSSTADFSGIGIGFDHYREYGIGVSHQLNEKLRLGLRAKYLYGMENIYTEKSDISISTDPNTYEIKSKASIILRTAGISDVDKNEGGSTYGFGRGNMGFGIDLGANYKLNDKWAFNASVIDLGYINWSSYTKTHSNNGGNFTYNGIAINAFAGNDVGKEGESSFQNVIDSLKNAFELKETSESYKTYLPTRIYIGSEYSITERDLASLLIQTDFFQGNIKPSFSLGYSRKMTKWISLATTYTVINNSYNNLGIGLNFQPGPIQFYFVSDNILGTFQPQHARHLQFRFGINLIFGSNKTTQYRRPYNSITPKETPTDPPTEIQTETPTDSENADQESSSPSEETIQPEEDATEHPEIEQVTPIDEPVQVPESLDKVPEINQETPEEVPLIEPEK